MYFKYVFQLLVFQLQQHSTQVIWHFTGDLSFHT